MTQSFATVPGTTYAVTFALGYGGKSGNFGGPVKVTAAAGNFSGIFTSGSGTPNPAVWDTETFNFTATSATTQLAITGLSTAGGQYIGLDHVDVELGSSGGTGGGTVPEPGTAALFIAGMALVGWTARRRT